MNLLFFLFQIFYCSTVVATAAGDVDAVMATACFYDVGQGHCFLLTTADKAFAVLVDAGSSKAPKLAVPQQTEKSKGTMLSGAMLGKIGEAGKLLVICTHGDADHYNLIQKIVEKRTVSNENTLFIFGGKKDHYENQKLPKSPDGFTNIYYSDPATPTINSNISKFLDKSTLISVNILSNGKSVTNVQKEDDKNTTSLIVKVSCSGKSFLLVGDAPSSTLNAIQQNSPDPLKSDVLLASHHGASQNNDYDWYNRVAPDYIIFSHGDHEGYWHPHPSVVQKALEVTQSKTATDDHVLFYGFKTDLGTDATDKRKIANRSTGIYWHTFAQCFSKYRNLGYRLMLTNAPVFSTYTQGNIEFDIQNNGNMDPKFEKKPGNNNQENLAPAIQITRAYLKNTALGTMVTDLYFNNQNNLANDFVGWGDDIQKMGWLSHIDFTGCDTNDRLVDLIRKNDNIRTITVSKQHQSVDAAASASELPLEKIKTLLGNRSVKYAA